MAMSNGAQWSGVGLLRGIGRVGWGCRQFCEQEGLTLRTFEEWYRRQRRSETSKGRFVEVKAPVGTVRAVGGGSGIAQRRAAAGARVRRCGSRPSVRRILAYSQPVDLRKSIDGLVGLVKSVLAEDPFSGSLFVFVNRRGNYVKLVSWDRTGWCLFAKRLEHGRFHFPQCRGQTRAEPPSLPAVARWD